jgi:hypothetical protein
MPDTTWKKRPTNSSILEDEMSLIHSLFHQVEAKEIKQKQVCSITGRASATISRLFNDWKDNKIIKRPQMSTIERTLIQSLLAGNRYKRDVVMKASGRSGTTMSRLAADTTHKLHLKTPSHQGGTCKGNECNICLVQKRELTSMRKARENHQLAIPLSTPHARPQLTDNATTQNNKQVALSSTPELETLIEEQYGEQIDSAIRNVIAKRLQALQQ